ncbi:MAG: 4Fe-4S binding protein [Candidatus Bathyarchaeota archaeon]|nr:4Fe-4S binding protein [Candidatus Bathyarchaeum sp.]
MVIEVKIDYRRCINCKKCVESCTFGVLEWFEDQPIVTNPSNCSACLKCKSICSVEAINIKAK